MAKYRVLTKTFIAPHLLEEGTIITVNNDFVPGPHLEPMDSAAEDALEAYYKANPHATLHPIDDIPNNGVTSIEVPAVSSGSTVDLSLAEAQMAKPKEVTGAPQHPGAAPPATSAAPSKDPKDAK